MKIAFIDPARAYDAAAPWQGPLGGTQSAVCYLAIALAKLGHTPMMFNHIAMPLEKNGVQARNWQDIFSDSAGAFDALVLVGRWTAEMVVELAQSGRPVFGWMHESAFTAPSIVPHPSLSGIVYVSAWQQRVNAPVVPPSIKTHVIQNAINPFVEALARDPGLFVHKNPNRAIYAGDTVRGLIPLLDIWPDIHALNPHLTMEIYSDPELLGVQPHTAAQFKAWLSALPGLAHIGKVGQEDLARAMARATWHLSPNPYPETSCITLMEALALGCKSIITARAALPETAHGFATLVPVENGDSHRDPVVPVDAAAFVEGFKTAAAATPDLSAQQAHFLTHHTWAQQAVRWAELLSR